jgi:hypothetical protein
MFAIYGPGTYANMMACGAQMLCPDRKETHSLPGRHSLWFADSELIGSDGRWPHSLPVRYFLWFGRSGRAVWAAKIGSQPHGWYWSPQPNEECSHRSSCSLGDTHGVLRSLHETLHDAGALRLHIREVQRKARHAPRTWRESHFS